MQDPKLNSKRVSVKKIDVLEGDQSVAKYTVENVKIKSLVGELKHANDDFCKFHPFQNIYMDWRFTRDLIAIMKRIQQKLDKSIVMLNKIEFAKVPGARTRKVTISIGDKIDRAGIVKWHSPAREYCYFPAKDIVLSAKELREILSLIVSLNKEYLEMKKNGCKEGQKHNLPEM